MDPPWASAMSLTIARPRPAPGGAVFGGDSEKFFENARGELVGNPGAGVGHGETDHVVGDFGVHRYLTAGGGEFQGVG